MGFSDKLSSHKPHEPIVTVELSPPKGTDASGLLSRAATLQGWVDAINIPDCQLAILKMGAMATAKLIQDETGIEAIWQVTCRDRNLIALQADLLGGYALGLRTVLALTGDPVQLGDQKEVAKQVFHLEAVRLLELLQHLNNGQDATGKSFAKGGTQFTVGAALNPGRLRNQAQQNRLAQKIERGVHFFQTQPAYSLAMVEAMMETVQLAAEQAGRPAPRILVGIIPPKSADAARHMNRHVTGVEIPQEFIDLLDRSDDPATESIRYCAELVHTLQSVNNAFHLMPIGMAAKTLELVSACFPEKAAKSPAASLLT